MELPPPPAAARQQPHDSDRQTFADAATAFLLDLAEDHFESALSQLLLQKNALRRSGDQTTANSVVTTNNAHYSLEDSHMLLTVNEMKLTSALQRRLAALVAQSNSGGPGRLQSTSTNSTRSPSGRGGRGGGRGRGGGSRRGGSGGARASSPSTSTSASGSLAVATASGILEEAKHICDMLVKCVLIVGGEGAQDVASGQTILNEALTQFGNLCARRVHQHCGEVLNRLTRQRKLRMQAATVATAGGNVATTNKQTESSSSATGDEDLYEGALRDMLGGLYNPLLWQSEFAEHGGASLVMECRSHAAGYLVRTLDAFASDKQIDTWTEHAKQIGTDMVPLTDATAKSLGNALRELVGIARLSREYVAWVDGLTTYGTTHVSQPNKLDDDKNQTQQQAHFGHRVDYLMDSYTAMERFWFDYNARKAAETSARTSHGYGSGVFVFSIVENIFYVAKAVSFARAVHTGDGQTTIGVANYAVHHLGDEKEGYTGAIRRLLREQSSGGVSDHEDENIMAPSSSLVDGLIAKDNDAERRKIQAQRTNAFEDLFALEVQGVGMLQKGLLYAVNTVELSVLYLSELSCEVHDTFAHDFPSLLPIISSTALDSLRDTAFLHEGLRVGALQEVYESCLMPGQFDAVAKLLEGYTYEPNHATYEQYQLKDPFMARLVDEHIIEGRAFITCRQCLSQGNFIVIAKLVASGLVKAWTRAMLQTVTSSSSSHDSALVKNRKVNALGAMLFSTHVDLLEDALVRAVRAGPGMRDNSTSNVSGGAGNASNSNGGGEQNQVAGSADENFVFDVRSEFASLRQWAMLLDLHDAKQVQEFEYPLERVLTAEQVRKVLHLRFPEMNYQALAELDVSGHVVG